MDPWLPPLRNAVPGGSKYPQRMQPGMSGKSCADWQSRCGGPTEAGCVCLCKTLWELQETSWGEGKFLYKKLLADGGQLTPGVLPLGFLWPLSYPQLIGCSKIQATSIKQFGTEMLQGKLQLWQKNPTTTHQHVISGKLWILLDFLLSILGVILHSVMGIIMSFVYVCEED